MLEAAYLAMMLEHEKLFGFYEVKGGPNKYARGGYMKSYRPLDYWEHTVQGRIIDAAREGKTSILEFLPPNAESFYKRLGYTYIITETSKSGMQMVEIGWQQKQEK